MPEHLKMPCGDCQLLQKNNRSITNLKEDIRRLSDELKKKDRLLTSFIDITSAQSKKLAVMNSAIANTVLWDPATRPGSSSCSTPNHRATWTEVVRGRKKSDHQEIASPPLNLSNRFAALLDLYWMHSADLSRDAAAPTRSAAGPRSGRAEPVAARVFHVQPSAGINGNNAPGYSFAAAAAAVSFPTAGSSSTSRPGNPRSRLPRLNTWITEANHVLDEASPPRAGSEELGDPLEHLTQLAGLDGREMAKSRFSRLMEL
ncbi:hypothetical protein D5F01_LYC22323 [Xyrichtys novacula]|uniref:Uncharacterized protein n=1 Tax=Xyrichtys novacula TaxID=13765 RepID=A0AAV1G8R1_XYRNO|nr:hypothetical protein D5F01_LYC22323 [Xyrichtys novacula]